MWAYNLIPCLLFIFWSGCPYAKQILVYVNPLGYGGLLSLEVMTFSDKEKQVLALVKKTSLHKKMYQTKMFYQMCYTWSGP